ncbi:histidine kinase [Flammeovirgaceae bacterium 311]|nr:histidine kinase [Flammeovirgaceae bacterium 311]
MKKGVPSLLLENAYQDQGEKYLLREDLDDQIKASLKKALNKLNSLYIIDAGEGMTQNIIRDHWMTIGTDNKAFDIFTKSNRVKSGAKGIGRFALDKLGSRCEMTTVFNPINHDPDTDENGVETNFNAYKWIVNWDEFEGDFKTIDRVNAELIGFNTDSLREELTLSVDGLDLSKIELDEGFRYGTILRITELRENWDDYYVQQVYSDLEVLVPPKESSDFQICLFSTLEPEKYGEVLGSICDDFDYKIIAKADENQNVKITIYRNEYDLELIDPDFFSREAMMSFPFRKLEFQKGFWSTEKKFSQLLPGYSLVDDDRVFNDIGVFEFTFYFMKRGYSSLDAERFSYRKFMANFRKDWLTKFGGIKLFRDNFRVRPYGEVKDSAFDWLGLGARKSQSPAGVGKEDGGYRVEPENIAGAIKISRLTNVNFEDKSSREGLQENKTFQIFKLLITNIIALFEEDRATIAKELSLYYNEKHYDRINKEKAEELAKSILEKSRKRKDQEKSGEEGQNNNSEPNTSDELTVLAELNREKDEVIEKLKDEQKVLRGLASSGIVLASFSHDLSKLNDVLNSRVEKLKKIISNKINEAEYADAEERKNPFVQLEKMRKQDVKLQNWLNFSLGAARKDKRKRNQLFLHKYFNDFRNDWLSILENRGIEFDVSRVDPVEMRVFEIDFDSIFNNLLVIL